MVDPGWEEAAWSTSIFLSKRSSLSQDEQEDKADTQNRTQTKVGMPSLSIGFLPALGDFHVEPVFSLNLFESVRPDHLANRSINDRA